ncbi:MotA/TolQ/ExbB proton channel family protein [Candidatus Auribacterota bacterium]
MLDIMIKGGFIMYPLLLCSIVSVTIVLERIIFWFKQSRYKDLKLVIDMLNLAEKNQFDEAVKKGDGSKYYLIRILLCGILHLNFSLTSALEMAATEELKKMRRFLSVLDTIITLSPLLGILGTVIGIINSFDMLGQSGIPHPEIVSMGISQALITTATGLIIAIMTLIPYNYFLAKLREAVTDIEKYTTSLEIVYNKNQSQKVLS